MSIVKNITIDKQLAIKVGVNASAIFDYILQEIPEGRFFLDISNISIELPIMTKSSIRESVKRLIKVKYIKEIILTSEQKHQALSTKQMKGLGIGNRVCEWCGCKTTILHRHHYPIARKDNGTKVVNICANCHYEFHHLTSELIINEVSNRG